MPARCGSPILFFALLGGCASACRVEPPCCGETGSDDDDDDDDWDDCLSRLVSTFPEDGQVDVYPRSSLEVQFGQDERTTAVFSLRDGAGDVLPLAAPTWSDDGRRALLTPATPLARGASYVLELDYSCDTRRSLAFTTMDLGTPVQAADVKGASFLVVRDSLRTQRPEGGHTLILALADELVGELAMSPQPAGDASWALALGRVTPAGAQRACAPTVRLPVPLSFEENPFFEAATSERSTVSVDGVEVPLESVAVTGAFTSDGASIVGLAIDAVVDLRTLGQPLPDLEPDVDGTGTCDLFRAFLSRDVCAPCGDGERVCLPVTIVEGVAVRGEAPFVEVSDSDAASCETDRPAP